VEICVPISVGELVDKITILKIKKSRILDSTKSENISLELAKLLDVCVLHSIDTNQQEVEALYLVNEQLWEIEDKIREKEDIKVFDQEFIELARSVYLCNDRRFELKRALNEKYHSKIIEEKSYKKYQI
jgi:hypothetical protein